MNAIFQGPARRAVRILLALLIAIGMTAVASATTQQHALASACATLNTGPYTFEGQSIINMAIPSNTACNNVVVEHVCTDMGGNAGINAIECADIDSSWTLGGGNVDVWGEGEYYCQGPGGYAQCKAMSVNQLMRAGIAYIGGADTGQYGHPGGNYTCSGSGCSTTKAMVATYHWNGTITNACSEAFINQDDATNSITVPDGDKITDPKPPTDPEITICLGS